MVVAHQETEVASAATGSVSAGKALLPPDDSATQRESNTLVFPARTSASESSHKVGGGGVAAFAAIRGLKAVCDYGTTLSSSLSSSSSQTRGATCLIAGDIEEQVESLQHKKQRK